MKIIEFGFKLGVSLDNGFARINTLSLDAYHEAKDLIGRLRLTGIFMAIILIWFRLTEFMRQEKT